MAEFQVKRCFVALPVDEVVVADLADAMGGLVMPGMRRTPLKNLHVTVKFLGDVDDPQLPQVIDALTMATEGVQPFELDVQELTYIPHARRPRVLAAKLNRPPELERLHEQVEELTIAIGFQKEGRAYNPHITLGRYRKAPREVVDLGEVEPVETGFRAERMVLMQSVLEREGPRYVELAEFAFGT